MRHLRSLALRKPRNDFWNNIYVFVLHKTWVVLFASVDQYLRTTVDSIAAQPAPIEIGAVVSKCPCCGKSGHEKSTCRLRNAQGSNCGNTGHLKKMCRQREKSGGKSSPSSSSCKSSGKGGTSRSITEKCYCCGQFGHRKHDCRHRNENCSRCGKRGHTSQMCQSGQGANANARAVETESDDPGEEEYKEIQHVWAMSVCNTSVAQSGKSGGNLFEYDHGLWC